MMSLALVVTLSVLGGGALAVGPYRPEWPSKSLQQEIFLLNLEDGYFGCQVNESQDFLQLFELSHLCDGQAQCYLGTDELAQALKCNNRERCGTAGSRMGPANQPEPIQCVNGVCLDGLCYCNDGYGGKSCDVPDENECKFRPCDVFAHCTNTMGSYYCSCFPGYDGDGMHCQDINECEIPSLAALCADNSECCNLPGHFVCKCKPGYQQAGQSSLTGAPSGNTTVSCTDIDECQDERACGKGAICENLPGSFRCSCPPGFTGDPTAECIDMDECRNNPCGAGAQCTNVPGGYRCSCAPGFERNPALPASLLGSNLQGLLIESLQQHQQQQLLLQMQQTNGSIATCLDINECVTSGPSSGAQAAKPVCGANAQCINTPGGFFCQCPPNYTGNPKVACQDIDECATHACGPNSQCKNLPGSFKCECRPGFSGNAYSADGCQDEDECLRAGSCGENAQCFNSPGSFQCACPAGFAGDPNTRCVDVDECASPTMNPCGPGAKCHNLPGGYKCTCPDKYLARGTPDMGCERAAVDIGCSGDYDCTQNAQCLNATCQCRLGYQIRGIDCVDVDECALSQAQLASHLASSALPPGTLATTTTMATTTTTSTTTVKPFTKIVANASQLAAQQLAANSLCGAEATCANTDGSYRCDCRPGYEKAEPAEPTSKCRDTDECAATGAPPCGPNARCFNTEGSFKCTCNEGFIPVDEMEPSSGCKSPCEGVNCGQHATCKPHGEEAACVCKPGFTFDPNNIKLGCVDINECDTNYGPAGLCGLRAVCNNVPGSYRCSCPPGFTGDAYRYCEDVNECDRRFGVFGQCGELAVCNNTLGSFTCACAPGYTGDPRSKCADIDECSEAEFGPSGKCAPNALCTNAPGKFACRCPAGYAGDPYEGAGCKPEQPACLVASDCGPNQVCRSGRCHCPFPQPDGGATSSELPSLACRHPCERNECGAHATCQLDAESQPICVCEAGYMAPSDGRSGCVDVNECIQGVTLSGMTPISALASGRGGVALGPSAASGQNGSHPCGRNALCRNQPGSFDCVCPTGYSGNAYEACTLDARNQQQQQAPATPPPAANEQAAAAAANGSGVSGHLGNYQQEPRTNTCPEPCPRGQACFEGQCVRADACRDHLDCRPSQACEHLSPALGLQCVGVCESARARCGPNAGCRALNHRPVCVCNTNAGFAHGDPYDLELGCSQHPQTTGQLQQQQQQQHNASSIQAGSKFGSEQHHMHRTSMGGQSQGDLSTVSLGDYQTTPQQMTTTTTSGYSSTTSSSPSSSVSSMEQQIQRQQQLSSGFEQQTKRPPSAYDAATTPALSQFGGPTPIPSQTGQQSKRRPGWDPDRMGLAPLAHHQQQQQQQLATNQSRTSMSQLQAQQASVSCTSDQHCPGNLFCLAPLDQGAGKLASGRVCGCPAGYKREADFCYMQRVNCSSSSICRAREECVAWSSMSTHNSQFSSQQFTLSNGDEYTGICICPRGYKLTASGLACIDRNECDEGAPCAVGAICQNKIGSYECICPPGTQGEPYTKTCEPMVAGAEEGRLRGQAECQSNMDCANDRECDLVSRKCVSPCYVCGPRAICTAANHAAICLCPPRYTGNAIDLVYGCQEPPPPTTTTTTTSTTTTMASSGPTTASGATTPTPGGPPTSLQPLGTTLMPPSLGRNSPPSTSTSTTTQPPRLASNLTGLGVPVTTLLPSMSTTTLAPGPIESTTPELVEFRTIPPSELFVMCLADGIQVEVQLGGFDGIIYVKGHSQDPKCRKLVTMSSGSAANEFVDFKVQFGNCDLIHRDGEAGFVLVIQKHPKLVTYRARAYHVKCVYNTGERTVTLGFNVSMITTSGTIANTGPPPTCLMSITALDGREVTSAEIGQDLLLRVDVQPDSIYGGFARSCEAKTMNDDGEYQYEVTDANGCATDPSIFSDWKYDQQRKSLVARFNAFKFPSSNNLRFQCNIRVCFGSCPAVNCNGIDAYGKRRRRRSLLGEDRMLNMSAAEPEASDSDDSSDTPINELIVTDTFKEGALREEIMVQSNAILTFDRKEASLPQQQKPPQVEDIEFVCLPRLGMVMSVVLASLLAILVLSIATSCWCFNKRKGRRYGRHNGPLPHPADFPNPLMHSPASSASREPIYGP